MERIPRAARRAALVLLALAAGLLAATSGAQADTGSSASTPGPRATSAIPAPASGAARARIRLSGPRAAVRRGRAVTVTLPDAPRTGAARLSGRTRIRVLARRMAGVQRLEIRLGSRLLFRARPRGGVFTGAVGWVDVAGARGGRQPLRVTVHRRRGARPLSATRSLIVVGASVAQNRAAPAKQAPGQLKKSEPAPAPEPAPEPDPAPSPALEPEPGPSPEPAPEPAPAPPPADTGTEEPPAEEPEDIPEPTPSPPASEAPADAPYFGASGPGTQMRLMGADYSRASSFQLAAESSRPLRSVSAYVDGNGSGTGSQVIRAVVYADASGSPGPLVASSREVRVLSSQGAGWVDFPVDGTMALAPGRYWLGLHSGIASQVARYGAVSETGALRHGPDTYGDGALASGAMPSTDHFRAAARAHVGAAGPELSVTSPLSGQTVSGTVTISGSAVSPSGVSEVRVYVDGALRSRSSTASYSVAWDTSAETNGTHEIRVAAEDSAGAVSLVSRSVSVYNSAPDPEPAPPPSTSAPAVWSNTLSRFDLSSDVSGGDAVFSAITGSSGWNTSFASAWNTDTCTRRPYSHRIRAVLGSRQRALRLEVRDGDRWGGTCQATKEGRVASGERAMAGRHDPNDGREGQERWWTWRMMLADGSISGDPAFPDVGPYGQYTIFSQFHASGGGTQPMLHLYGQTGNPARRLGFKWVDHVPDPNGSITLPNGTRARTVTRTWVFMPDWSVSEWRGRWLEFKVRVKWSHDPSVGHFQLWWKHAGEGSWRDVTGLVKGRTLAYAGDHAYFLGATVYRGENHTLPYVGYFDDFGLWGGDPGDPFRS